MTIHLCPAVGCSLTSCCGRSPFDLPTSDKLTFDAKIATCNKENNMPERSQLTIPHPSVRPLGIEIDRNAVRGVWDTFVKPGQDAGNPQSIEERTLMAILRAVYEGLPPTDAEPDDEATPESCDGCDTPLSSCSRESSCCKDCTHTANWPTAESATEPAAAPTTELRMIDGRDALLSVLVKPSPNGSERVVVEAHCNGLDKMQAAKVLIAVAREWKADAEAEADQ